MIAQGGFASVLGAQQNLFCASVVAPDIRRGLRHHATWQCTPCALKKIFDPVLTVLGLSGRKMHEVSESTTMEQCVAEFVLEQKNS